MILRSVNETFPELPVSQPAAAPELEIESAPEMNSAPEASEPVESSPETSKPVSSDALTVSELLESSETTSNTAAAFTTSDAQHIIQQLDTLSNRADLVCYILLFALGCAAAGIVIKVLWNFIRECLVY